MRFGSSIAAALALLLDDARAAADPAAEPSEEPRTEEAKREEPTSGWIPGQGFVLRSADGEDYRLRLRLQSAIRAQVAIDGKAQLTDPFMTLRPIAEGNIYKPWIRFWTSLELAANPVFLLDAYVEVQPEEAIGVRLGQQWTPFSRHQALSGPMGLLFPEWDPVAAYFWTGRDKGATLFGTFLDKTLDYALGGFMGVPLRQFETIRGNYQFIARIGLCPNGPVGSEYAYAEDPDKPADFGYAIGLNGATSKINAAIENFNPSTFSFEVTPSANTKTEQLGGADFFLQSRRIVFLTEGYIRRTDPHAGQPKDTSVGAWGQLGVLLWERKLDVAARLSWIDVNIERSHDQAFGIEGATSWYFHAPNVVFKLRYGYGSQQTPPDSRTTSGGAQLILEPGPIHIMTAQVNTTF
jgi:hypothetical protein